MRRWLGLGLFMLLLPCFAMAEDKPDLHWLSAEKGQGADAVIADSRFKDFIDGAVPDYNVDLGFGPQGLKTGLKNALKQVLGGPDDPVTVPDANTVVISACREGNCAEKGMLWVDVADNQSVLAIIHYVYAGKYSDKPQLFIASSDFECGLYPQGAVDQIKYWMKQNQVTPQTVRCLDGHKVSETIL